MQRVFEWADRHWTLACALACVAVIAVTVLTSRGGNVYAASVAKQQEPGCVQFATIGTIEIYHCIDPSGHEFEANSLGFMAVVQ